MSLSNLSPPLKALLSKHAPLEILQNLDHITLSTLHPYLTAAIRADHPTLTPFLYACKHGHTDLVKLFLLDGFSPITPNPQEQYKTALHYASEHGHDDTVRTLLTYGIPANAITTHGWTPLHYAAQGGHVKVVRMLVEQGGADMEMKTRFVALTPLHIAIAEGKFDVVPVLVQLGADVNAQNLNGATALHYVALNQEARTRAFTGIPGLTGRTRVSLGQRLVVLGFLIRAGADIEMGDNYEKRFRKYVAAAEIRAFEEKLNTLQIDRVSAEMAKREVERRLKVVKKRQEKIREEQQEVLKRFLEGLKSTVLEVQEDSEDEGYEDEGYEGYEDEGYEDEGQSSVDDDIEDTMPSLEDWERSEDEEYLDDYEEEEESLVPRPQEQHTEVPELKGNLSPFNHYFTFPLSLVWVSFIFLIVATYLKNAWPDNGKTFYY